MKKMLTFDTIAKAARKGLAGTVVRNCAPASIEEAKATAKKYPDVEILIKKTKHQGTCIAIAPKGYNAEEAIKMADIPKGGR